MPNPLLAPVEPSAYRWAVHACSYKIDLTHRPDRAVALFEREAAAQHFGRLMWPGKFEVVDLQASGEGER